MRYEKGLSVEEIWAAESNPVSEEKVVSAPSQSRIANEADDDSVELTFEVDGNEDDDDEKEIESVLKEDTESANADEAEMESSKKSTAAAGYEIVNRAPGKMEGDDLDDLDAEIAKELAELDDI
jgi:hypothetical protein